METATFIAETGVTWPTLKELEKAKLAKCPARGPVRECTGGGSAQCGMVAERHGKPHAVDLTLCKTCQLNGGPDFANPFLRCITCHLAWNDVIAGKNATEPLTPSDADIDVALGIVREYRGDTVARGFVDALVWNESITQEKADDLIKLLTISERAE